MRAQCASAYAPRTHAFAWLACLGSTSRRLGMPNPGQAEALQLLSRWTQKLPVGFFLSFRDSCMSMIASAAVFILVFHFFLVVSFAWATIRIGAGVTPASCLAKCSRSFLTSLAHPLGCSHCSTIGPSIHSELLPNTLFRSPRRRDETT